MLRDTPYGTHTPGPWYRLGVSVLLDRPGLEMTTEVARCKARLGKIKRKEAEANASLISAAPDLLAACEAALDNGVGEVRAISMLKAAIKKARGE